MIKVLYLIAFVLVSISAQALPTVTFNTSTGFEVATCVTTSSASETTTTCHAEAANIQSFPNVPVTLICDNSEFCTGLWQASLTVEGADFQGNLLVTQITDANNKVSYSAGIDTVIPGNADVTPTVAGLEKDRFTDTLMVMGHPFQSAKDPSISYQPIMFVGPNIISVEKQMSAVNKQLKISRRRNEN